MRMTVELGELVDLDRHPIDRPDTAEYAATLVEARTGLATTGCAVVSGLVTPAARDRMSAAVRAMVAATHYSTESMNPYFHTEPDLSFPEDHPVNTFIERSSGFIPRDSFASDSEISKLWQAPTLLRFLAEALDMPAVHPYADPLAGLTINVLDPGQQFCWHYDTNDYAVTVLLDEADEGGIFEYIPDIRSGSDECYGAVASALAGEHRGVISLELRPGDMQIFRGRNSLHRVTRVGAGSAPRYAAIFAYTAEADVIGRVVRTRQLFGRVLPEHEQAEISRVRHDTLLD